MVRAIEFMLWVYFWGRPYVLRQLQHRPAECVFPLYRPSSLRNRLRSGIYQDVFGYTDQFGAALTITRVETPEPSTLVLLLSAGTGLLLLMFFYRLSRKRGTTMKPLLAL
jgi:hypothetical protein